MKVKTIYTPTDQSGAAFSFATNLYALADLQKLAGDLVAAGVREEDALRFDINPTTGVLSITTEK